MQSKGRKCDGFDLLAEVAYFLTEAGELVVA
jgi:hypothetical protein